MKRWFLLGAILISCNSTKFASNFSLQEKHLTFERTKFIINSNALGRITLNGYISIQQDSLVCFKFYGPLSVDVMSGVYAGNFKVRDNYNKVVYPDFDLNIYQMSDFMINRKILESLLLGKISDLKDEILKINSEKYRLTTNAGGSSIVLSNMAEFKTYKIDFVIKKQLPSSILISYKDAFTYWSATIKNIYISNLTKKCNFGY